MSADAKRVAGPLDDDGTFPLPMPPRGAGLQVKLTVQAELETQELIDFFTAPTVQTSKILGGESAADASLGLTPHTTARVAWRLCLCSRARAPRGLTCDDCSPARHGHGVDRLPGPRALQADRQPARE